MIIENLVEKLKQKNLKTVYEKNEIDSEEKITKIETIFETKQNFYLYLTQKEKNLITIYYKPEQFSELLVYVRQLKKQFKNGTINN